MDSKICRTLLLPDTPAGEDLFGAHDRLANTIVELVVNEDGGKTIGLEGGWGSGKSTVINLIIQKIEKSEDNLVVLFDAWAHQGDPLRRTFLETLISNIQSEKAGWINVDTWQKKLDELARRRKVEENIISPN